MANVYRIVRTGGRDGNLVLCCGEPRGESHFDFAKRQWFRAESVTELARYESIDELCECALKGGDDE